MLSRYPGATQMFDTPAFYEEDGTTARAQNMDYQPDFTRSPRHSALPPYPTEERYERAVDAMHENREDARRDRTYKTNRISRAGLSTRKSAARKTEKAEAEVVPAEKPAGHGGFLKGKNISGFLKNLKIHWDAGDILLILILLFLFLEGEDEEIVILLAVILFLGL